MDVVLEVFDTFLFDRIYANALPISPSVSTFDPVSTLAASLKGFASNESAFNNFSQEASLARSTWQWEPSNSYFSLQPSEFAYLSRWDRDNIYRQFLSFYIITWIFGMVIYFTCASLSYIFVFDKTTFQHPKYLKNQMRMEIRQTVESIPIMAIFTVPFFVAEVRGYSFIYDSAANPAFTHPLLNLLGGWYNYLQFPLFLMFTDFCIYWIHRGLHHPRIYKTLHKPHHKWIMPTPFASHAFHPLDGYSQSVPYHLFPFIFPLQKFAYIALFTFIQIWTVMIHDGEYVANSPIINGAACHTMHHLYFNYNYGQFTTLWDRLGGSYRKPNDELFRREEKMSDSEWKRQTKEMERMVIEVEGKDDRSYGPPETVKKVQ
ncbi:C-5 sterol desaturase [Cercospora beticola]|uniref:C-5 sterol desaturase n=1 Tax=Cercospora beticola TaxID=122368 RepID=A0A2G5HHM7_CERBT|nr:C-5 sterol desaturase [Cercospora beticola]PIA92048.1 C-5 sterol desaturase [Cercospora beticola]WPB05720.1 Delta(7)-sterol 5(6)-desaturas erg3A [Cercospora beticola]